MFKKTSTALAALALSATVVQADEQQDRLAYADTMVLSSQGAGGSFATLFGAPSAITAPKQTASVAVVATNPRGGIKGNESDADLSFSYALGNPVSAVGVTLGLDVTSLKDDFGDAGSFSLTLSRLLHVGSNSVTFGAISGSGLGGWGAQKGQERASIYVTQLRTISTGASDIPFMWTLGYGQDAQFVGNGTGNKEDGVFWGMGVGVAEFMSFSVSGTENQVNAGVGLRIPGVDGLNITVGQYDVSNKHKRTQTAISVSYSMRFGG